MTNENKPPVSKKGIMAVAAMHDENKPPVSDDEPYYPLTPEERRAWYDPDRSLVCRGNLMRRKRREAEAANKPPVSDPSPREIIAFLEGRNDFLLARIAELETKLNLIDNEDGIMEARAIATRVLIGQNQ